MSVLIVTRSDDNPCVDAVRRALAARGVRSIRFDTDHYPTRVTLSSRLAGRAITRVIADGDARASLDDVTAVWYRRFHAGARIPTSTGDLRAASVGESRRAALGLIAALPCFHLDPLESVRRADHKELQLDRAAHHGLDVPRTLVTNDPDAVRAFVSDVGGAVVTKMQHSFAVDREGEEHVVFTSELDDHALVDLDGLALCPMVFQERLEKAYELRVTVVGERVLAARVDSAARAATRTDWRRDGVGLLDAWTPYDLPAAEARALTRLLADLGLNYGAADFVVTPDGRHVFLEVNAGGEYFWLDRVLPISDEIAALLAGERARNASGGRLATADPALGPRASDDGGAGDA